MNLSYGLNNSSDLKMIPRIIHYCWFGRNDKPKLAKKCIASWQEYCPDYRIIEWNEDNFDVDSYPFAKYCLEKKNYAFLSDFVRLVVILKFGGIYLDTDVELLKPLDALLSCSAFYGFENDEYVNTGHGFGAEAENVTVMAMLHQYEILKKTEEGDYIAISCPKLNTEALLELGLTLNGKRQTVAGAEIYPTDFFNPYDDQTGKLNRTDNTYSIHWYSKSWISKEAVLKSKITRPFHRIFGVNCFQWLKK